MILQIISDVLSHLQLHCVKACGGSVLTGLQTPARWRARPRAESFQPPRLAPGKCLPTPHRDVNRPGPGPKRDQSAKQWAAHHTRQPQPYPVREPPATVCSPYVSGRGPLLVSAWKLLQHKRGPPVREPPATVCSPPVSGRGPLLVSA